MTDMNIYREHRPRRRSRSQPCVMKDMDIDLEHRARSPQPRNVNGADQAPLVWTWRYDVNHWLRPSADSSHVLAQYRTVLFCEACGAWSKTAQNTKLSEPCPRQFTTRYARSKIDRLWKGWYPYGPGPNVEQFEQADKRDNHPMSVPIMMYCTSQCATEVSKAYGCGECGTSGDDSDYSDQELGHELEHELDLRPLPTTPSPDQ